MAINPLNTVRLTGMSTGMDTDALVKAMSQNQQLKTDALFRKKVQTEWKRDAINDVNNIIRAFKDEYTSLLGAKSMMKTETYRTMSFKNTNEQAVSLKASVNATAGTRTMSVEQLATAARYEGKKVTTGNVGISATSQSLQSLFNRADWAEGGIETTTITDSRGVSHAGYEIEINGQKLQFKATDKLSDVMNAINNNKNANATLTYSQITNSFTLNSKTTGAEGEFEISEESSHFFRALGLDVSMTQGENSKFTIDGVELEQASNTFSYDGIEYTLNSTTKEAFSFTAERDLTKSMDTIKEFVGTLNDLIANLNNFYSTRKDRSYSPLTDETRAEMSETEAAKWDEQAKKGILYRDEGIGKIMTALSKLVTAKTDNGSLSDIGITGAKWMSGAPFALEIDEDKLMKALEDDPDKVYNIFAEVSDKNGNEGGIIARIDAAFDTYTSHTKSFTLQTLRDNILDYEKNITAQTDKLYTQQERLYVKFASFEASMAKLNSQQSTIANYFG